MCGIAGLLQGHLDIADQRRFTKALDLISHRGPDNTGIYTDDQCLIGHKRLSIIDLNDSANQPMEKGGVQIVYNGEVYNYRQLRSELELLGANFDTESDTEVVLEGFLRHGTGFIERLNGMFAFAIIDKNNNTGYIARDRFGIKPLFYTSNSKSLIFASEMKVISEIEYKPKANKQGISEWLYYGTTLGTNTLYSDIKRLSPGSFIKINLENLAISEERFWTLKHTASSDAPRYTVDRAVKKTRELLEKAVDLQLVGDVPVGTFLSGGIDSSAITALAALNYPRKLSTFSVCFDFDKGVNELPKAAQVARMYKTSHNEVKISGYDLTQTLEHLIHLHDAPFSDAANIPLFLLAKKIHGEIKVVLQGDGGDELFGGYRRHQILRSHSIWKHIIKPSSALLRAIPLKSKALHRRKRLLNAMSASNDAELMGWLLTEEDRLDRSNRIFSTDFDGKVNDGSHLNAYKTCADRFEKIDITQKMLYTDSQIILPDLFFEKVDRSTMGSSLEVRVPFLDNDLFNFAVSLPSNLKVRKGVSKWILRKALEGIVPDNILYGKKIGFGVPYGYWIKEHLYDYFMELLDYHTIGNRSVLDRNNIISLMQEHKNDSRDRSFILWKTLNLMIWMKQNEDYQWESVIS